MRHIIALGGDVSAKAHHRNMPLHLAAVKWSALSMLHRQAVVKWVVRCERLRKFNMGAVVEINSKCEY